MASSEDNSGGKMDYWRRKPTIFQNPNLFFDIKDGKNSRITMELFADIAPKIVENFRQSCIKKLFHKVIKSPSIKAIEFVKGDCTVDSSIYEDKLDDKIIGTHSTSGLLSMAIDRKNSNGCRFYITCEKCEDLDNKNVIFGRVLKNSMQVVRKIEKAVEFGYVIADCGEIAADFPAKVSVKRGSETILTIGDEGDRNVKIMKYDGKVSRADIVNFDRTGSIGMLYGNIDSDYMVEEYICTFQNILDSCTGDFQLPTTLRDKDLWDLHFYPSSLLLSLIKSALSAVLHIHKCKRVHRDIALKNFLVCESREDFLVKLCPLGVYRPRQILDSEIACNMTALKAVFGKLLSRGGLKGCGRPLTQIPEAEGFLDSLTRENRFKLDMHIIFWNTSECIHFISRVASVMMGNLTKDTRHELRRIGSSILVDGSWKELLEDRVRKELKDCKDKRNKGKKEKFEDPYSYTSVDGILVLLRDSHSHFENQTHQYIIDTFEERIRRKHPRFLSDLFNVVVMFPPFSEVDHVNKFFRR